VPYSYHPGLHINVRPVEFAELWASETRIGKKQQDSFIPFALTGVYGVLEFFGSESGQTFLVQLRHFNLDGVLNVSLCMEEPDKCSDGSGVVVQGRILLALPC
jgi:hypothetical protein